LHRPHDLALVLGAGARDAPREDLGALGDESLQQADVLVIDEGDFLVAELAELLLPEEEFPLELLLRASRVPTATTLVPAHAPSPPPPAFRAPASGPPGSRRDRRAVVSSWAMDRAATRPRPGRSDVAGCGRSCDNGGRSPSRAVPGTRGSSARRSLPR